MFQSTGSVAVAEVAVEPVPKRARVSDEVAVADADETAIEALFAGEMEEFKLNTGFEEFVVAMVKQVESLGLPVWEALAKTFAPTVAAFKDTLQKCREAMPFLKCERVNYSGFQRRSAL